MITSEALLVPQQVVIESQLFDMLRCHPSSNRSTQWNKTKQTETKWHGANEKETETKMMVHM